MESDVSVIIVAGGYSERMGGGVRKPYLCVNNKPIFFHTLEVYNKVPSVKEIIFVVNELDIEMVREKWGAALKEYKVATITKGGKRRQDSVFNGLKHANPGCGIALIHDCVRPFITEDIITSVIEKSREHGAAIVAVPVKDTIKEADPDQEMAIKRTVPRANLWAAQTPQGFKMDVILEAHKKLQKEDFEATDDAQIVERYGHNVGIVKGSYENIKITTPEDLKIAEALSKF